MGSYFTDLPGGLDTIETRKPDIQQNQVRLQLLTLLNGFQSVRNFSR